jgi:hypothetical protein
MRRQGRNRRVVALALALALTATTSAALADTGGAGPGGTAPGAPNGKPRKGKIVHGKAKPPRNAPPQVVAAIKAGNHIRKKPYVWGGGHGRWEDRGYDCSGTVSYMLHAAGLLDRPMDSGELASWGDPGQGGWISVAANGGHTYIVVAGLRMDTSGSGGKGPRWSKRKLSSGHGRFAIRHYGGL